MPRTSFCRSKRNILFSLLQGRSPCKQGLVERSTHIILLLLLPHLISFFFSTPPTSAIARVARGAHVVHDVGGARRSSFGLRSSLQHQIFVNRSIFVRFGHMIHQNGVEFGADFKSDTIFKIRPHFYYWFFKFCCIEHHCKHFRVHTSSTIDPNDCKCHKLGILLP